MQRLNVMLREYDSLRQESLETLNHRNQILSFGLATVGALAVGTFLVPSPRPAAVVIAMLNVGLPFICLMVVLMWVGEIERWQRVGNYLARLEAEINSHFERPALRWEAWLRLRRAHIKYPYYAVGALFFGVAFLSPALGLLLTATNFRLTYWPLTAPWMISLVVLVYVLLRFRALAARTEVLRSELTSLPGYGELVDRQDLSLFA